MATQVTVINPQDIQAVERQDSSALPISLFDAGNFKHYMDIAKFLSSSTLIPKGLQNKPADVMIIMEMSMRIGLPMMQGLQDIGVINGRPVLWGDGLLALAMGHKDFEWIEETPITNGAQCIIKRKGSEPHKIVFTIEDAKKAGLWGKSGPWTQYPARMLQMRARSFCVRNTFADALKGIKCEHEAEDIKDYQVQNLKLENPKIEELKQVLIAKPVEAKKEYKPVHTGESISSNPSESMDIEEPTIACESVSQYFPPKAKKKDKPEIHNTGRDDVPASFDQINRIDELMREQEFTPERKKKAFDYFKIQELADLTEAQAVVFLMQLEK